MPLYKLIRNLDIQSPIFPYIVAVLVICGFAVICKYLVVEDILLACPQYSLEECYRILEDHQTDATLYSSYERSLLHSQYPLQDSRIVLYKPNTQHRVNKYTKGLLNDVMLL